MGTARKPSLRGLRNNLPANVVILPNAAARQVQQRGGPGYMQARRDLEARQAIAFPYKAPFIREQERPAQSLTLRADVPAFDPGNPEHLRAWEALWDFGQGQPPGIER